MPLAAFRVAVLLSYICFERDYTTYGRLCTFMLFYHLAFPVTRAMGAFTGGSEVVPPAQTDDKERYHQPLWENQTKKTVKGIKLIDVLKEGKIGSKHAQWSCSEPSYDGRIEMKVCFWYMPPVAEIAASERGACASRPACQ